MAYTTIDNPELYFQIKLYTGDGSTPSITLDGDTDMQPDFVWIKNRDEADSYCLFDAVRGAAEVIHSDTTALEATDADTLTSFDSDGFALGADVKVNTDTEKYVAWCWKESATSGFDIVSYTGDGNADRAISHSLSAKPDLIFNKTRDTTAQQWSVYHSSLGATKHLGLDRTNAEDTGTQYYADTEPTTSVFSVGTEAATNYNTAAIITYLWKGIQGFSKFGSYTGNADNDGPFIYTGFRPAFIIMKQSDRADNWVLKDNKRPAYNPNNERAWPSRSNAFDDSANNAIDMLSNGFKHRSSDNNLNDSGGEFIYMAWAESPFVNSNGVPNNAK